MTSSSAVLRRIQLESARMIRELAIQIQMEARKFRYEKTIVYITINYIAY